MPSISPFAANAVSAIKRRVTTLETSAPTMAQHANVQVRTITPAEGNVAFGVVPVPLLLPQRTRVMWTLSFNWTPRAGCTQIVPSLNRSTDEQFLAEGNFAFWIEDVDATDKSKVFAAQWLYDPRLDRPGDPDFVPNPGDFVTLHVVTVGGNCDVSSVILQQIAGDIPSVTVDETSLSLLDGKGNGVL